MGKRKRDWAHCIGWAENRLVGRRESQTPGKAKITISSDPMGLQCETLLSAAVEETFFVS
jgi:hypothetical protein